MYESDNILIHMFDKYTNSKSSVMIYKGEYSSSWHTEVTLRPDEIRSKDEVKLSVNESPSLEHALGAMQSKLDAMLPHIPQFDPNKALEYRDVASGDREAQDTFSEVPF